MTSLSQAEILELPEGLPIRPLPPLAAVRAFEASVRLQSFSRAAYEMNMTPAAISYQVKQLEARLGLTLFQRLPRKVVLTRAGEQLAPAVLQAFKLLQGAFSSVAERAEGGLSITTLPTLASSWLIPRLGRFQRLQPGLRLRLDTSVPLVDLELGTFDVSIRTGSGNWPGMEAHFLFADCYTPLLSPALAARVGGIREPRELQNLMLLGRTSLWQRWLEQVDPDAFDPVERTTMDFGIEHYDATVAIAGDGVAMASPLLFAREIETGQLVQPITETVQASRGFWLAYPKANARAQKIRAFRRWLLTEAGNMRESPGSIVAR
jgi:LysR family glycine cleavage system transcriptional activator